MRESRRATAAGENEILERRQRRVERVELALQPGDVRFADQRVAGYRQLAAEIEEIVLDRGQRLAERGGKLLREQHAERAVELIDVADRRHASGILRRSRSVGETGRAVVAGTRVDLREALAHVR